MSTSEVDISIVIPCLDERDYIGRCIDSLLRSAKEVPSMEVLIADGMSKDGTREIISELATKDPRVRLIDNPQQSTPHALNIGLKAAKGSVKVILGAHSEVADDFLKANLKVLAENPEFDCVGGVLENVYEDDLSKSIGLSMSSSFGVGNAHFRTGAKDGEVDTVAFGAYRAEVFDRIGYFDEELLRNQDDEFNYRLTSSGGRIFLSKEIGCKYYVRASFEKLAKQYRQYGFFKVLVNKKHGSITTLRQLVPAFFVLYLFSIPLAFLLPGLLSTIWMIPLNVYLIAAIVLSFKLGRSKWFLVLRAFLTLHITYGLGYLHGILHFLILGRSADTIARSR